MFFFFKQKTAYEMRISDWSSDVCSSDLTAWHGSCQTRRSFVQGLSRGVGTDYHSQMTLSITSAFDGGNIRVLDISGHRADLEIVKDQNSDFHQWFYFRLAGAAGEEVELRKIGRPHVGIPVTNAHHVCRLLFEKKKK